MRFDSAEDAPLKLLKTPENFLLYRYSMYIASGGRGMFSTPSPALPRGIREGG